MTTDRSIRGRSGVSPAGALWLLLLLAAAMAWLPDSARAVEVPLLYTVEVPLDPDDPEAQSNAYRTALGEVLVRITGSTAAARSEEITSLFPNPIRYVRQFRPGPDDTLIVSLDGPAIERILRQAGATVWGSNRPLTILWLAVDYGLGDREIVAANDLDGRTGNGATMDRNQTLRERVQAAATRRGIPIVFPLLDGQDLQSIGFVDIWGGFDEPLLDASARYEADSILVGRLRPDESQPARWTWYFDNQRFGWPGGPEEAIDQLADALAARNAIRGDEASESIELTISGIDSVVAYGRVQQLLENLRVIDKLRIRAAQPDRITYVVEVRGGTERLNNALALSNLLERAERDYFLESGPGLVERELIATSSLEYRYRPPPPPPQSTDVPRDFDPDR